MCSSSAVVFLATEWPDPPEGRWNYAVVSMLTEAFNRFYQELNLVTYSNGAYDIGVLCSYAIYVYVVCVYTCMRIYMYMYM